MKILGYRVEYLARVRIGKVYLGELRKENTGTLIIGTRTS